MEDFDSETYLPECKCGQTDTIKRERDFFEREYLTLDEDGNVDVDTSDMEGPVSDWRYECAQCGASSSDLEMLLAYRPDEDDPADDDLL